MILNAIIHAIMSHINKGKQFVLIEKMNLKNIDTECIYSTRITWNFAIIL